MRNWLKQIKCKDGFTKFANVLAMAMVIYTANAACMWLHHQPEVPDDVRKFRKF